MSTITLKPIDDQVVVIAGSSSGIGHQTAIRFAGRGARIVLSGRDADALERVSAECLQAGAADVAVVPGDVSSHQEMEALASAAQDRFGRVDTWAHIAGVDLWATFEETTPDE